MTALVLRRVGPLGRREGGAANVIATVCCYVALYVASDWISFIHALPGSGYTPWNPPPAPEFVRLADQQGTLVCAGGFRRRAHLEQRRRAFPGWRSGVFGQRGDRGLGVRRYRRAASPHSSFDPPSNSRSGPLRRSWRQRPPALSRSRSQRERDRRARRIAPEPPRRRCLALVHRRSDRHHRPASSAFDLEERMGTVSEITLSAKVIDLGVFFAGLGAALLLVFGNAHEKERATLLPDVAARDLDRRASRSCMERGGDPCRPSWRSSGRSHMDGLFLQRLPEYASFCRSLSPQRG